MSYQLSYDADSRLIISGVECDCPCEHNQPKQDIYVGNGIVKNIAHYIRKRGLGEKCVLVADNITWEVAGKRVHDLLAEQGIRAAVVNCSTVKPLDEKLLRAFADRPLFTMEEHVLTGGFASAVTGWLVAEELPAPLITFGLPDTFVQHGSRGQLLRYLGLMPEQMVRRILAVLPAKEGDPSRE